MPLDHRSPHVIAPKAVFDHNPCDQMVTLQTSGVDLTTASNLVQRDSENSGSIAQVAAALLKQKKLFLPTIQ